MITIYRPLSMQRQLRATSEHKRRFLKSLAVRFISLCAMACIRIVSPNRWRGSVDVEPNFFDQFVAKTLLGEFYSEEAFHFLSSLVKSSREGNLCMLHVGEIPLPPSLVADGKGMFSSAPVVKKGERVYLQKNWVLETHLAT